MKKFILVYWGKHGEHKPEDPKAEMKAWHDWMAGLAKSGNADKDDLGNPFSKSKVLDKSGVRDNGMRVDDGLVAFGFTPILAKDFDQATDIAKTCPAMQHCSIEIHETMNMPA